MNKWIKLLAVFALAFSFILWGYKPLESDIKIQTTTDTPKVDLTKKGNCIIHVSIKDLSEEQIQKLFEDFIEYESNHKTFSRDHILPFQLKQAYIEQIINAQNP